MLKKIILLFLIAADARATSTPCTLEAVESLKNGADVVFSGSILFQPKSEPSIVVMKPESVWRGETDTHVKVYISPKWQELPDGAKKLLIYGNWKYRSGKKVLAIPICLQPQENFGSEDLGEPIWEAKP